MTELSGCSQRGDDSGDRGAIRQWGRAHIPGDVDAEHFNRLAQQLIGAAAADAATLTTRQRAEFARLVGGLTMASPLTR